MRLFGLLCLLAVPAQAEVVLEMTPQRVTHALRVGAAQVVTPAMYRLKGGPREMFRDPRVVFFNTPFSRAVREAFSAKQEFRTIEPDALAPLLEPYVEVYAPADMVQASRWTRASITGVRKIVVTGPKGANPVHATKEDARVERFHNTVGAEWEAQGLTARFPLTVVTPDAEVHVIYEDGKRITFRFDPAAY